MAFFSRYGTVWYDLPSGETVLLNDLTKFVTFDPKYQNDPRLTLQYLIQDGERPDTISNKLYETPDYGIHIMLLNGIMSLENEWPRSSDELDAYISSKYPFNNPSDVHHYITVDGLVGSPLGLMLQDGLADENAAITKYNLSPVAIYDYELQLNEAKRNIKLIDPDYIEMFDQEMRDALNGS